MHRLSIVIPCHNEAKAIQAVLDRFFAAQKALLQSPYVSSVELIVVDDASTDDSLPLICAYGKAVEVVRCHNRKGYGGALKKGFALTHGDLVAFYDMDATYDPFDLVHMIRTLVQENLDMVSGNRLTLTTQMPWLRWFGNQLFINMIAQVFHTRVHDSCSGLRVFRRKYLSSFSDLLPNNLDFALAMTILFLRFDLRFREVVVSYRHRIGTSKLNIFIDGPRFLITIIRYWLKYRYFDSKVAYAKLRLGVE